MATSVVYARLLGTQNLGILWIYVQMTDLVMAFVGLGLSVPTARFVSQFKSDPPKLERFVSTVFTIDVGSAAVTSIFFFLFAPILGIDFYASRELSLMFQLSAAFLLLNSLSYFASAVLQGLQEIRALAIIGIVLEVLTVPVTFLSLSLFGLLGAAIGGVILVGCLASMTFASCLSRLRRNHIKLNLAFDKKSARSLASYTSPLLVSTIVLRVAFVLQASVVALELSYADAGFLKVALSLYRVLLFVPSALAVPLLPAASELYATRPPEKTKEHLATLIRATTYWGIPVALAVGFLAKPIIGFLYGSEFLPAAPVVFVLAVSAFVEMVGSVALNFMLGEGRTRLLLGTELAYAGILTSTVVVFVDRFGLLGAAYSVLVSSSLHTMILVAILAHTGRLDLTKISRPFGLAAGGLVVGAMTVVWGGVLDNLGLALIITGLYAAAAWLVMGASERRLYIGIVSSALRKLWG